MILEENYALSNGYEIPKLGLGTWLIENDKVAEVVKSALKIGYRHIDTAQAYQNEDGVGKGIKQSGVKREDIFLTTKLDAEYKSYQSAYEAIDESLQTLGVDYIDLMIIHSPKPWKEFQGNDHYFDGNLEAWKALEKAYHEGKLKAIGLSNFEQEDVQNILDHCQVDPQVNQILVHIGNTPQKLIDYCHSKDIRVEAYSPIGHGKLMDNEEAKTIAEKYGVSVPQLGIRYTLQLDCISLPKSSNPEHIESNTKLDFEISEEDMKKLKGVKIKDYGEAKKFPVFA